MYALEKWFATRVASDGGDRIPDVQTSANYDKVMNNELLYGIIRRNTLLDTALVFYEGPTKIAVHQNTVVDNGCALSVGDEWIMLDRLPSSASKGHFQVQVLSGWIKVGTIRYAAM